MGTDDQFEPTLEEENLHKIFHTLRVQAAVVVEGFSRGVMEGIERARRSSRGSLPPVGEVALGYLVQVANMITTALRGEHESEDEDGTDDA